MSPDEKNEVFSSPQGCDQTGLDVWVAANQPQLHTTQRQVLEALNSMTSSQEQVTSRTLREHLGMSPQLLNRHLRTLGNLGLVHLENPGVGLPLLANITDQGRRALEARPTSPPPAPAAERPPALQTSSKLETLAQALYLALVPHMKSLDAPAVLRLVRDSLSLTLGRPLPSSEPIALEPAASAPAAPEPAAPAPAGCVSQAPPALNSLEQALEDRLSTTAHGDYRDMAWYRRTRELTIVWDQMRRRTWGLLHTYFQTFAPRWTHPEWDSFNRARRLADVRGVRYEAWVGAQFKRLLAQGAEDVSPRDLIGEEAIRAWEHLYKTPEPPPRPQPVVADGPPPFTPVTFAGNNPLHVAYAEQLLDDIAHLAGRVYGNDPKGLVSLVRLALDQGKLPEAALDLRPELKAQVIKRRQEPPTPTVSDPTGHSHDSLPIII